MNIRIGFLPLIFCSLIFVVGCNVLLPENGISFFAEQEWSDNYALLDGTMSTNPEMIDGDLKTFGETRSSTGPGRLYGSSNATEVIVTLPEKKHIRKFVIHSDNIKKFAIYADRGGTLHSETDWQLVEEVKMVKSYPVVVNYTDILPTSRFRIVVLDTTDDAAMSRRARADFMKEADEFNRNPENRGRSFEGRNRNFRVRYPARISEIELYGLKSAKETANIKSDQKPESETELDQILE